MSNSQKVKNTISSITHNVLSKRKPKNQVKKNLFVAPQPKQSTSMNSCKTRYTQNPPSLVPPMYSSLSGFY